MTPGPPRISVVMHTPHEATRRMAAVLAQEGLLDAFLVPFDSSKASLVLRRVPAAGKHLSRALAQWQREPIGASGAPVQELACAVAFRTLANRRGIDVHPLVRWRERSMRKALARHLRGARPDAVITMQRFAGRVLDQPGLTTAGWLLANSDVWGVAESLEQLVRELPPGRLRDEAAGETPLAHAASAAAEAKRAKAVLVESPRMATRLRSLVLPGTPVVEIGQAIDVSKFVPAARDDSARPLRVVQVSRVVHAKGLTTANDVVERVRTGIESWRVVGWDGIGAPRLIEACPNLAFTGGVPPSHVVAELQRADVFILPTLGDSMPRAVLEAMACGLPVITTHSSSYGHVIRNGENGFIVADRDAAAMAEILRMLREDGALRERIGRAARATAEEHTWGAFEARFARTLREDLLPTLPHPGD